MQIRGRKISRLDMAIVGAALLVPVAILAVWYQADDPFEGDLGTQRSFDHEDTRTGRGGVGRVNFGRSVDITPGSGEDQLALPGSGSWSVDDVPDPLELGEAYRFDEPVRITSMSDFDELPAGTPEDFVRYLETDFENSRQSAEEDAGCVPVYYISAVSSVNIGGNTATARNIDDEDEFSICSGNPHVWFINDDEEWQAFSVRGPTLCETIDTSIGLDDMEIYEEFIPNCTEDPTPREPYRNPNGSIRQLVD